MSRPDLDSINRQIADRCFPQNLDTQTAALAQQRQINLADIAPSIQNLFTPESDGLWNRACSVLTTLLGNANLQEGQYRWAYGNLLQLLMTLRDPRHELLQQLLDGYTEIVDASTRPGIEEEKEGAKRLAHQLKVLKRSRNQWFPRARQQANSKSYVEAALRLGGGAQRQLPEDSTFFVLGTCFADNIHAAFSAQGLQSEPITHAEEMPVERLFADLTNLEPFTKDFREMPHPCIIFTLGFAEFDMPDLQTEEASTKKFDAFQTPEVISQCILDGASKLRELNENFRIFLTVSPVPLEGTTSSFNIFEANSISKSIVRLAVAMACNADPTLDYFPSYEIVTQIAPSAGHCPFGDDDGHPRHVNRALVALICALFMETYCPWLGARG